MIMMEIIQSDQSIVHGTVGTVPFTVSAVEITFGPPRGSGTITRNKKQESATVSSKADKYVRNIHAIFPFGRSES